MVLQYLQAHHHLILTEVLTYVQWIPHHNCPRITLLYLKYPMVPHQPKVQYLNHLLHLHLHHLHHVSSWYQVPLYDFLLPFCPDLNVGTAWKIFAL